MKNCSPRFYRYIKQAKDNNLVVYLVTRYLTYFIQFLTSLLLANKLGPTNYGIWGFMVLLMSYFSIANFGLGNAMNVLLVQNRDDEYKQNEYIKNDMFLVSVLGCVIVLIMLVYWSSGMSWFSRYTLSYEFFVICIIAILSQFNSNFINIWRVKNDFYRIAFNQSVLPLLYFFCTILFDDRNLLLALLYTSLIGNLLSIIVFTYNKPFAFTGRISREKCTHILSKGWWLFIYNLFFYLILVSTRTLISKFYSVEDFGRFTFSFTMGDAVLLLFQSAANIVFPKVLAKLGKGENNKCKTIKMIDNTYVTVVYFAVLVVCCLFPVILLLFPEYKTCAACMSIIAITMAVYTNVYAYTSYLITNNKERLLVLISFICLTTNVITAVVFIKVLYLPYTFIILSTLVSYYLFYVLCALAVQKDSREKLKVFNWRLHLPALLAVILSVFGLTTFLFLALLIFIVVNWRSYKGLITLVSTIWKDYRIINV